VKSLLCDERVTKARECGRSDRRHARYDRAMPEKPNPFAPVDSPYLVPFDGTFRIADASTAPPDDADGKKENERALHDAVEVLDSLQRVLYAHRRWSVLLVFQAMDAAGKDGTVRAVMRGVNPAGCQVWAFKQPSPEELDHDFLWRCGIRLPERGRIGIWNRSHYEEVLTVKVNPGFLDAQRLPRRPPTLEALWAERYESIRNAELHWARNGVVVLKFFLNVSRDEQRKRFLDRIDDPEDNWKFSAGDLVVRKQWDEYMAAYQDALNETSRPWAPWYAIPADSKAYMRRMVADITVRTMQSMHLTYPRLTEAEKAEMDRLREELERE
jgi:PPK2 family polyphosphate:nucleotide phosphotransferase